MKFYVLALNLAALAFFGLAEASPANITERADLEARADGHAFTLVNKCSYAVTPKIANTRCGYSPRTYASSASADIAGQY